MAITERKPEKQDAQKELYCIFVECINVVIQMQPFSSQDGYLYSIITQYGSTVYIGITMGVLVLSVH